MADHLLRTAALACCAFGVAWLALAMKPHWHQVRQSPLAAKARSLLRVQGGLGLAASLLLCFYADHASMAPLVWVMALAGSALLVAFTLAWRPRWLSWLAVWIR